MAGVQTSYDALPNTRHYEQHQTAAGYDTHTTSRADTATHRSAAYVPDPQAAGPAGAGPSYASSFLAVLGGLGARIGAGLRPLYASGVALNWSMIAGLLVLAILAHFVLRALTSDNNARGSAAGARPCALKAASVTRRTAP